MRLIRDDEWTELACGDCGYESDVTTCGGCEGMWCDRCDPAHGPLCPWCHGRGYSTHEIRAPRYRQANHIDPPEDF